MIKYSIEFIVRPLAISRSQFEYSPDDVQSIEIEGYSEVDVLREFALMQSDFLSDDEIPDIIIVKVVDGFVS